MNIMVHLLNFLQRYLLKQQRYKRVLIINKTDYENRKQIKDFQKTKYRLFEKTLQEKYIKYI